MKKKLFISFILTVLMLFTTAFPVFAWAPDRSFYCDISAEDIPENTYYIDFLMPIPERSKAYVGFNEENGEKFGIKKDSEIVKYCEDGFVSYTFHTVDADSRMIPFYHCSFEVSNTVYEENKDLFKLFNNDYYTENKTHFESYDLNSYKNDEIRYYSVVVEINSPEDKAIKQIEDLLIVKISENPNSYLSTEYNTEYNRVSEFDKDYCCKKFRYAKMAYLDKDGNIISVSNKAKIKNPGIGVYHLNLYLKGDEFTVTHDAGPPYWILGVLIFAVPIVIILAVVVLVFLIIKKYKKG